MNNLIQCSNLSKQFGSKHALRRLNFELDAGAPIALVGPNGAGKTTLFSILCGYLRPTEGEVTILGHKPGATALFGQVAALPQDAQLDPRFSISRQLMYYAQLQGFSKKAARSEAERVLSLVELSDVIDEKPDALSHGMRKRVTIAQALMGSPKLIMLDEPTAGLDPRNARNIRQMVAELSDLTTFIISSHNLQELERLSQTVLYLEHGQISQHSDISSKSQTTGFLTIQMNVNDNINPDIPPLKAFSELTGVTSVTNEQKNDFVIEYDADATDLDQRLLACIASNGWNYHQLIKGKTLEEQLFAK
ncbi:MAG: ABC-2 type transport system ATP-binding protein [Phenylobacterium sp.]|jgi:ABC-2 type transport system ATP-binding protein